MIKILAFAVVILAALWFTSGAFAHENINLSNLAEFDFYFDDKSLNESTRHDNPLKTETTEFSKNDDYESIVKPQREDANENFAVRKLNRLIHYFISLLHSINESNSYEEELLHNHKFRKEPHSKDANLKTNRTTTIPRIYKDADTEIRDAEFENSGTGNDSEYYDEENSFKNTYKEESEMKIFKSGIGMKPGIENHAKISGGKHKSRTENHTLTSEDSRYNRKSANHSRLRTGQLSDEFIDEYINPPAEKFTMKSYGASISNQPINSIGRGNKSDVPLEKNYREKNISKIRDRKLINSQNPVSDNITRDMNTTLAKELEKDEFPWKENKKSDNTTHKRMFKQTEDLKNKNLKEISTVENPAQNSFQSNRSTFFIGDKPQNNKNNSLKISSLSVDKTSKILNQNSSSPDEINQSHSQISNIPRVRNGVFDKNPKNFSVLDDSRKNQASKENIVSTEPQMHSKKPLEKVDKTVSQQPLNSTKSFEIPGKFNKTNRSLYENSSINTESENATNTPSERQFVKYPELESNENLEVFNASEELKIQTDSSMDSDSSEYSNSEELYEYDEYYDDEVIQLMSNFTNYFTETFSNATTQSSENFTAPFTNYSMEIELSTSSKNDSNINPLHKTPGIFNSILEFLYKYSNSTWIKKLEEENRRM